MANSTPTASALSIPPAPKPKLNITTRPVLLSDHVAIAHLCAAAFIDDDLLTKIVLPDAIEFPEDIHLYYLHWVRSRFWDWLNWMEVAVISAEEVHGLAISHSRNNGHDGLGSTQRHKLNDIQLVRVGDEYIVGFSSWLRLGDGGRQKMSLRWYDPRSLLQPLAIKYNNVHSLLHPNRALDPSKTNIFPRALPYYMHIWSGPRAECWHLMQLATHPLLQGRGIGRALTARGTERATRDGICASVSSAPGKEGFYQCVCGFGEEFGDITAGEGNPLKEAGYTGGRVFWFWPEGVERPIVGE